jgi:small subunit ribosomal protein S9
LIDEERQDEQEQPEQEAEEAPAGDAPAEEAPAEQAEEPAPEEAPADEAPADEAPAEGAADEPAPEEAPAEEAPAEEAADEPALEEAPAEEAPAEEATGAEAPAAEAPAAVKDEKKKDVVPGAELEPIAIEPEQQLDAEERARREAEEEERARREAELTSEADQAPLAAKPAKISGDARFLATGKRKSSVARVILTQGSGSIQVNERGLDEYFPRSYLQSVAKQPLVQSGYEGNVDVRVRVHGGGISGQAAAVRHGIARALCDVNPELRPELKRRGMLTRDARVKERRKAGLKKARKRPQFSKR